MSVPYPIPGSREVDAEHLLSYAEQVLVRQRVEAWADAWLRRHRRDPEHAGFPFYFRVTKQVPTVTSSEGIVYVNPDWWETRHSREKILAVVKVMQHAIFKKFYRGGEE